MEPRPSSGAFTWVRPSRSRVLVFVALAATLVVGCSGGGGEARDVDAAVGDGGAAGSDGARTQVGAPCEEHQDCPEGTFCDPEIPLRASVQGLSHEIDIPLFPGGSCSPFPIAPYDPSGVASCDPLAIGAAQGCGVDGVCLVEELGSQTLVACRAACTPHADRSGCSREGYTCDFSAHACVEGCQSDDECRLRVEDSDGDGLGDVLVYDAVSRAVCNPKTARCTHPSAPAAESGTPCMRVDDCESDGTCLRSPSSLSGHRFPGGFCTKLGCDVDGRQCVGEGSVCETLRPWASAQNPARVCLTRCEVGAEPPELRVGSAGHGLGCRPGYRCHYNGGPGKEAGVCVGGVYNDVTEANLGAACEDDSQCHSPFGYGRCLLLRVGPVTAARGTCSLLDCNAPGLPDDLCGSKGECIGLRDDLTFCVRNCSDAYECADGYACADDDEDPETARICYPACFADEDCRKGEERCAPEGGAGVGRCVASAG